MISMVITCYNEEEIIVEFIKVLSSEINKIDEDFQIIFIDNKSTDQTLDLIKNNLNFFENAKIICLSNYFGKESGILAGLDIADGDATIIMDPDLEDPPSLLQKLIDKWKEGNEVVYAKRKTVELPLIKRILRNVFYFVFKFFVNEKFNIPDNTGDFRILDKKVREQIISMRERTRFLRGLVSFVGFKQTGIYFDRQLRKKGKSKSTIFFLIKYGIDAILSSTRGPAGLISKFGLLSLVIVFIISIFILINKFFNNPYEGFSLTILLILFLFSLNTLMIGIVGEYVTRIYDEVKQRPIYIINEIIKNKIKDD